MAHLSLALLGAYQVTLDDTPVTAFESDKVRALLAYLAAESHQPHRRQALAGLLWPDMPEASARHNLSQVLFNLRQVIGDRAAQPPFLLVSRETIQFNTASDHTVDVAAFTALIAACETHPHPQLETCDDCAQRLQQAVALYRGDFLHHFFLADSAAFEEWALLQREYLHRRALTALTHLAAYYERHEDVTATIRLCERQLALDPWREETHQQLMRVLAASGQRSAALAQYETCRRVLANELGVEPSAETRALYEQIRTGAFDRVTWRPGATDKEQDVDSESATTSALHPQVDARRAQKPQPAIAALPAAVPLPPIFNLPAQLTTFIGRDGELGELHRLLADPACRLLTLVGPGGMGKTRLALQAASQLRTAFAHGVAFVALAPLMGREPIVPAVADAIQLRFDGPTDLQRQLLNYLQEKELLLVLDNFEHLLVDGQSVASVQAILQATAGVKLLVTSREPLALQGEWLFEVEGLGNNAADLFVQSARRARAGFALSAAEQPQVERICQLVGAMPLGIELAASWVRVLPLGEIAGEIERNLDFLTTTARDAPPRHRSMRAVFDHSWQLLTDEERRVLQRLSVFRGGFGREAAEQVAGVSLSLLSALVAKSLLHRTAAGRYDFHELVRQYAAARLQQDAEEEARTREQHSHYYAGWLQQQDHAIRGAVLPEGAAAIRAEIENIRLAWQWASVQRQAAQLEPLIFTLFWFYDVTNRFGEGIETFQQAAEPLHALVASLPDPPVDVLATAGHLLAFQGWFSMRYGRLIQARDLLAQSVALLRPLQAPVALSDALRGQGFLFYLAGDMHHAQCSLAESLAIKQTCGDDWAPGLQLVHQGILAYTQGEYAASCRLLRKALALVRQLGYARGVARALVRLGISRLAMAVDDPAAYDEAQALAEESLQLSQTHQDASAMAYAYDLLGMIAQNRGDDRLAESLSWFRKSLAFYREIGDQWSEARLLNSIGDTMHRLGDPAAASVYREALTTALAVQVLPQALDALAGLAALAYQAGDPEQTLLLASWVATHPHASPQAKARTSQLQQTSATQLSDEQAEAIRAQSAGQRFDQWLEITANQLQYEP